METQINSFLMLKEEVSRKPFSRKNICVKRDAGLAYWRYRVSRPFLKLKYQRFQKKHPNLPWLAPDAIQILEKLLKGGHGLEYGSGRSTIFFAGLLNQLDSVEHHRGWYHKVKAMLEAKQIDNTRLHFVAPNADVTLPQLPSEDQMFMTEEEYPVSDDAFYDYVQVLDRFENASLDFILIDGRARKSCCLKALPKLKRGGLLVLDNSERHRYHAVHNAFRDLPSIQTTTGLTDTTIWLKK